MEKTLEKALKWVRGRQGKRHISGREMRAVEAETGTIRTKLAWADRALARAVLSPWCGTCGQRVTAPEVSAFEQSLARLEQLAPRAYPPWFVLLEINRREYAEIPERSCSMGDHQGAQSFRRFLFSHLQGRVLDIGCGPQPVPSYLADYPLELLAGIDPLSPPDTHPFAFVHGVAEFLPWPDASFETVVIATSLDHVLVPDRVFGEIVRVLTPAGRLVVWTSCLPKAAPYDPLSGDVAPVDEFHLFHVTEAGFGEMIAPWFKLVEEYQATAIEFYYCLVPRGNADQIPEERREA